MGRPIAQAQCFAKRVVNLSQRRKSVADGRVTGQIGNREVVPSVIASDKFQSPAQDLFQQRDPELDRIVARQQMLGLLGSLILFVGLWRYRRADIIPQRFVMLLLAMSVVATGLMMWTGFLGGQIRHTEVRAAFVVPVSGEGKSRVVNYTATERSICKRAAIEPFSTWKIESLGRIRAAT